LTGHSPNPRNAELAPKFPDQRSTLRTQSGRQSRSSPLEQELNPLALPPDALLDAADEKPSHSDERREILSDQDELTRIALVCLQTDQSHARIALEPGFESLLAHPQDGEVRHDLDHLLLLRAELLASRQRTPDSRQVVFDLLADGEEEAGDRHWVDLAVHAAERGEHRVLGVQVGRECGDEGFHSLLVDFAWLFQSLGDEDGCYQGQVGASQIGEGDGREGADATRALFFDALGAYGAGIAVASGGGVRSDG
jgi:hypothetical protein